ncbi:MAG: prephenate dehydratase [Acidimicrobiales bacterium]
MTLIEYLGPEGTFAHQATDLIRTLDGARRFEPRPTVIEVVHDVDEGRCAYGLVPIENSIEGGVTGTIDVLTFEVDTVHIREEVVVPVRFGAHRRRGFVDAPRTTVLSHPFGLAQCKRYWSEHGLACRTTDSTAEACRLVATSDDPGLVAIASGKAAALSGLVTVADGIEDFPGAQTRFALVGRDTLGATGDDKTTLVLTPPSEGVGILLRTLQPISDRGINISEIVSRPLRQRLGAYCFLLTIDRHVEEPVVTEALADLQAHGFSIKVLGSYPAWRGSS